MKKVLKNLLCLILCAVIILLCGAFAAEHMPAENPLPGVTSVTKKATMETVKTGIESAIAQIRTIIDSRKGGE